MGFVVCVFFYSNKADYVICVLVCHFSGGEMHWILCDRETRHGIIWFKIFSVSFRIPTDAYRRPDVFSKCKGYGGCSNQLRAFCGRIQALRKSVNLIKALLRFPFTRSLVYLNMRWNGRWGGRDRDGRFGSDPEMQLFPNVSRVPRNNGHQYNATLRQL